jgi:hypothetical protein
MATARPPRVMEFTLMPKAFEGQHGDGEGERHGHERDEGGAQAEQEEEQDDGHHDGSVADGFLEVADGVLDEVALAEEDFDLRPPRAGRGGVLERLPRSAAVSFRVSKPGALSMLRMTPMVPLTLASPRMGCTAWRTSATSLMSTGRSADTVLMTVLARSSRSVVMPRLRTMISCGPACRGSRWWRCRRLGDRGFASSASVTWKGGEFAGSGCTWICFTPPPMVSTSAMPLMLCSRRAASSRRACAGPSARG